MIDGIDSEITKAITGEVSERNEMLRGTFGEYFEKEFGFTKSLSALLAREADEYGVGTKMVEMMSTVEKADMFSSEPEKFQRRFKGIENELTWIHLTDRVPRDGILTPKTEIDEELFGESKLSDEKRFRATVHGCVSSAVISHYHGKWTEKNLAVLVPFGDIKDYIQGFEFVDAYGVGAFEIPGSSRIVTIDNKAEFGRGYEVANYSSAALRKELLNNGIIDQQLYVSLVRNQAIDALKKENPEFQVRRGDVVQEDLIAQRCKELDVSLRTDDGYDAEKIEALLPDELIPEQGVFNYRVSTVIETPLHYAVMKEQLKMGKLPIPQHRSAPPFDTNWLADCKLRNSKLESYLQNEIGPPIYYSVWGRIENIWQNVIAGNSNTLRRALEFAGEQEVLPGIGLGDVKEKITESISPGGYIWQNVQEVRSEFARGYGFKILDRLRFELGRLQGA